MNKIANAGIPSVLQNFHGSAFDASDDDDIHGDDDDDDDDDNDDGDFCADSEGMKC